MTAKSLGGGLPLAAVTGRAEIMDAPGPGGLGGTFAGNPLSCAAALAVLDLFEEENLWPARMNLAIASSAAPASGSAVGRSLETCAALAACRRIELVKSQRNTESQPTDETNKITQYCYEHGLITITAGSYSNVIRVLVPLVVTDEQMDEGLDVLESGIAAVCDKKGAVAQLV